ETPPAAGAKDGQPPAQTTRKPAPGPKATAAEKGPQPPLAEIPLTYVNSKRFRINYESKDVGPLGVAAVELWYTRDGRIWELGSVVDGGQAPLVFTAPEEGRYGFTVVVKGGSGMSGERPRAGQPPQHWVEVDVTPPTVKLFQLDLGV